MKPKVNKETGEIEQQYPYIRKPYERTPRVRTPVIGKSMTHQSHASSCDINNIIRKFDNTGVLPPARHEPQYADVTALQGDLTEAYNKSLETTSAANKFIKERQEKLTKKQKETEKQKQLDLEKQIDDLKKRLPPEPQSSGSSPPPNPKQ